VNEKYFLPFGYHSLVRGVDSSRSQESDVDGSMHVSTETISQPPASFSAR